MTVNPRLAQLLSLTCCFVLVFTQQGPKSATLDFQSMFGDLSGFDSVLQSLAGSFSSTAHPFQKNLSSLLKQTMSSITNRSSGDTTPLQSMLNLGSQAPTSESSPAQKAANQRSSALLSQLQDSLDGLDSLFNYPEYPDLLTSSGFNVTELLDEDHPMVRQVALGGEKFEQRYCKESHLVPSQSVPTSCTGGSFKIVVDGGSCHMQPDKSVRCTQPKVVLVKTPPSCAYHHKTAAVIVGKECKLVREFGSSSEKLLKPLETATYDISKGWEGVPEKFRQMHTGSDAHWTSLFSGQANRDASAGEDTKDHGLLGRLAQKLKQAASGREREVSHPVQRMKEAWSTLRAKWQRE